jgi:hypothetical protein
VYELYIDPLALLLPSDVYGGLVESSISHVADIQNAVGDMNPDERAFIAARAQLVGARAKALEEALTPEM